MSNSLVKHHTSLHVDVVCFLIQLHRLTEQGRWTSLTGSGGSHTIRQGLGTEQARLQEAVCLNVAWTLSIPWGMCIECFVPSFMLWKVDGYFCRGHRAVMGGSSHCWRRLWDPGPFFPFFYFPTMMLCLRLKVNWAKVKCLSKSFTWGTCYDNGKRINASRCNPEILTGFLVFRLEITKSTLQVIFYLPGLPYN